MEWTPGAPNIGQVMPPAPPPGGENVLITSEMNTTNGLQNDIRTKTYLLKIRRNESTNIVYTADNWFRLYSVKTNGLETLSSSPVSNYTLQLDNIQSNINVKVHLDVREDMQEEEYTPDMIDWLQGFDDAPFAPTYLNALNAPTQLKLREKYWINANPTTTNVFTFKMHEDGIHLRPLYLTLEMMLHSNLIDTVKIESLRGGSVVKAVTTFGVSPIDWFLTSQFRLTNATFDSNNKSRVYINEFPDMPAVFKWSLELEDPRSVTQPMINVPKP
jgi:hypothetical protein